MDDIGEFLRKNYKIIIPLILVIFIILGILIVKSFYTLIPESGKANIERIKKQKFDTINELFEYYESEFVSIEKSYGSEFVIKLSAKLKLLPYEGIISNEDFYVSLLKDIAYYYDYQNFILLDSEKELKISVICENFDVKTITVNGIEDYFIKKREEQELRKFRDIKVTSANINEPIVNELIECGWENKVEFGSKDSMFEGYDIYFDEGIEVRKIQGKIYNVIFTDKYTNNIINGLTTQSTKNEIKLAMGEPTFVDNEVGLIGYKCDKIYVFFYDNCISIYRRDKTDTRQIMELLTNFKEEKIDILGLMNELTYMWPDYNEYIYDASSLFISYPLKGFEIKVNYENERGIIFYNNFNENESVINKYLDSEDFKAYLQEDYVFKTEKNRILSNNNIVVETISNDFYQSNQYDIVFDKTVDGNIIKVSFISKDNSRPNRELNDSCNSYAWISDTYFVFGKNGKGLYGIDLDTGVVSTLLSGTKSYNITKSDLGVIICDNVEQRFEF